MTGPASSSPAGAEPRPPAADDDELSVRQLAAIVHSSVDAILSVDAGGTLATWNRGAERIYGYPAGEVIGRTVELLDPPGEESEWPRLLARAGAGERTGRIETVHARRDGRLIDVALTVSPLRDESGSITGASVISRDVSAVKTAERRLEQSARHFDLSHDLIATCDLEGRIEQVNSTWESALGWSRARLLGRPLADLIHPGDRGAFAIERAALARGEARTGCRWRTATETGGWRWVEWSASPDLAAGRFYCSGRDITTQLEIGRALERERRQFAEAQQIARVGSWETVLRTGEQRWSAQQYRNLGFDPGEPVPSPAEQRSHTHPDDRHLFDAFSEQMRSAEPRVAIACRVLMPDGELRSIEAQGRLVTDPDRTRRYMGTTRDVTAEREADRLKDEFLALVSHELRTPLTSILGYTELLAELDDGDLSERGKRFVEVIERNSRRQLDLVGDLLLLNSVNAGTFSLEVTRADLGELATAAVEAARPAADRAELELGLEAPAGAVARADRQRIAQVLENLISNAIKFTPTGGRIGVAVESGADGVAFVVSDTGIGIGAEDLGRVFDPSFRSQEAERRRIQGSGLGLAITKAIVDAHEATIVVESEPGRGSSFRVELPRAGD